MTLEQFSQLNRGEQKKVKAILKEHRSGKVLKSAWQFMQLVTPGSRSFVDFLNANHTIKQATLSIP